MVSLVEPKIFRVNRSSSFQLPPPPVCCPGAAAAIRAVWAEQTWAGASLSPHQDQGRTSSKRCEPLQPPIMTERPGKDTFAREQP